MEDTNIVMYDKYLAAGSSRAGICREANVREDKEFYIPNLLAGEQSQFDAKTLSAATAHAGQLSRALRLLGESRSLVGLLTDAFANDVDDRATQAVDALRIVEKKLRKAGVCIDIHDTRHTNLFLAYADLFEKRKDQ